MVASPPGAVNQRLSLAKHLRAAPHGANTRVAVVEGGKIKKVPLRAFDAKQANDRWRPVSKGLTCSADNLIRTGSTAR